MPKYNAQEAARLQAIADADPAVQAAYRSFISQWVRGSGGANERAYKQAKKNLEAAINANPELKRAKVAEGTISEGYQWQRGRPTGQPFVLPENQRNRTLTPAEQEQALRGMDEYWATSPFTIGREGSDWGHVWRDMILPAAGAGAIFAAPAIIGSQAAAGGGSAGSAGAGSAGATSALTGANTIGTSGVAGAIGAPTAGSAGGLGSILTADRLRMAGQGLGAIANAKAQNRSEQFAGQSDLARLLLERDAQFQNQSIAREQEGSRSGLDAWRRLLMAQRTLSPGPRPQLSPYSIAPRQATGAEREGATAMSKEVMARLLGGNPIPVPQRTDLGVDPRLLRPGRMEQILGYAAPIATGAGTILRY